MKKNNEEFKTILCSTIICLFCFGLGIFIFFIIQSNILCNYTDNNYICKTKACLKDCNTSAFNHSTYNQSVFNQSVVNQSVVNQSVVNQSVVNQSVVNQSVINQSVINQSVINQSVFNKYLINKSIINSGVEINSDSSNASEFDNKSVSYLRTSNSPENYIENKSNKIESRTNLSLLISLVSVFAFVGCFFGSAWYIKYKPNPIKKLVTNSTASKQIPLTPDELEQAQINPILKVLDEENKNILVLAIKNITKAVKKDNGHYFEEAINLYELGTDQLIQYMKIVKNGQERFKMAKKIDVYMKRVLFLKKIVANQNIATGNENITMACVPGNPLLEKKCVCNANTLI